MISDDNKIVPSLISVQIVPSRRYDDRGDQCVRTPDHQLPLGVRVPVSAPPFVCLRHLPVLQELDRFQAEERPATAPAESQERPTTGEMLKYLFCC